MPIGIRRQARMIALQTLYEYDTVQHLPEEILQRHIEERHLQPKVVEYARELVMGVCDHLAEIDAHRGDVFHTGSDVCIAPTVHPFRNLLHDIEHD